VPDSRVWRHVCDTDTLMAPVVRRRGSWTVCCDSLRRPGEGQGHAKPSASDAGTAATLSLRPIRGLVGAVPKHQYVVSPDGRFLISTELDGADAPITRIQNWQPEAKK
jgi:hypothetical protein